MTCLHARMALIAMAWAGHAPDQTPDYPDGWCDLRYGTPTRTTGECMCKYRCEGGDCESSQGFIWYSYSRCPSCRCVAADPSEQLPVAAETYAKEDGYYEEEPPEEGGAIHFYPPDADMYEPTFSEALFEFFDEHGHAVLAVGFVLIMVVVFVPLAMLGTLHGSAAKSISGAESSSKSRGATDKDAPASGEQSAEAPKRKDLKESSKEK